MPPMAESVAPLKIAGIELECAFSKMKPDHLETKFGSMGVQSGVFKELAAILDKNLKPFAEKHLGSVRYEMGTYRIERGEWGWESQQKW